MYEKTRDNLLAAFAGESQARNKYTFFAAVAKKEGWLEIAEVFEETAKNEKEHAEVIFKLLGSLKDTAANLEMAIAGENYEATDMYPEFAGIAREEGWGEAAKFFEEVAKVEAFHARRFQKLLEDLKAGRLLKKEEEIYWQCRECGYIYRGTEPPLTCPVCSHPREYYKPYNGEVEP